MDDLPLYERLLQIGKEEGLLHKFTTNESSDYGKAMLHVQNQLISELKKHNGYETIKTKAFSGHVHTTYRAKNNGADIEVRVWTYRHKGSKPMPYTMSVHGEFKRRIEDLAIEEFRNHFN